MANDPKPKKQQRKRTSAENAAIYRKRVEEGRRRGLTPSESVGKKNRDSAREYQQRVARELASGKRKTPPKSRPRNNKAPTGAALTGSARYDGLDAARQAERRTLAKLRSDRRVFVYVQIIRIDLNDPLLASEEIDLEELIALAPSLALSIIRELGEVEDVQLWPNGGIRAQTLRAESAAAGDLETVILRELSQGNRYRTGSDPSVNPKNRKEQSPILREMQGQEPGRPRVFVVRVVLQWSA